jgi:predicted RNA binding protein YcfA (HicA-like mRNA interferase family)
MKAISGKELARIVERHGWTLLRINGSHRIYGKSGTIVRLSIPIHGNAALKTGLLRQVGWYPRRRSLAAPTHFDIRRNASAASGHCRGMPIGNTPSCRLMAGVSPMNEFKIADHVAFADVVEQILSRGSAYHQPVDGQDDDIAPGAVGSELAALAAASEFGLVRPL